MYIKRALNKQLTTFRGSHYPYTKKETTKLRYNATIGIGGNIADVKRRFEHLFFEIRKQKRVQPIKTSLILKNPPFGYIDQDDFFNSIMIVKTDMQPQAFLTYLLRLEKKFGRKRSFENAPRTLDLDIIFFDNRIIETKTLQVPHPSWSQRESVLIPLMSLK